MALRPRPSGSAVRRLGLRYHRFRHEACLWAPTVYDRTRPGHQVSIRLNRNATVRGPGINFRRLHSVRAVRVAVPEVDIVTAEGTLRPLGREWSPPYGMDDWAPSIGETLGTGTEGIRPSRRDQLAPPA